MTRGKLISLALATALFVGACSSDSGDDPSGSSAPQATGATGASDVCADVTAVQESVDALTDIELESSLPSDFQGAVEAVQADLDSLKTSASDEVGDEVGALESSLEELASAAETLTEAPDATTLAAVAAELTDTVQAWDAVVAAVPDC